ncbi:hypothetical protein ABC795_01445 [Blastococcus sp. HT6-30]|uniref:hypothetical protein n=1 Tax=Blastococcus sp. HT6-30 TaxID=3144843 RepID=UPI00321946C0
MSTALGAAAVGVGSTLAGPEYTSEAQILWDPDALEYLGSPPAPENPEALDRQVTDQRQVVLSDAVIGQAADSLDMDPEDLREAVAVEVRPGTSLLTIAGPADEPDEAAALTTTLTSAYVNHVRDSGVDAIQRQADLLQPTIDRLVGELEAVDAELGEVSAQLAATPVTAPAYGVLSARADRLATRSADIGNRLADQLGQQETLRGTAESFPGQAFLLREPSTPEEPSSLSLATALVLGAAIGLFIGVCIVFFLFGRSARSAPGPATGYAAD